MLLIEVQYFLKLGMIEVPGITEGKDSTSVTSKLAKSGGLCPIFRPQEVELNLAVQDGYPCFHYPFPGA